MGREPRDRLAAAAYGIVGILFAIAVVAFFPFTADDSYITARYAENLVENGALEFNPGDRINALTSPLHALLEAALFALTGNTILTYKGLALALLLGSAWLLLRDLRSPTERVLVASILLLSPPVVLWTFGGLETPLLLFLVTLLSVLTLSEGRRNPTRLAVVWILAGLAFLTRFDSVLFTGPVLLHATLRDLRPGRVVPALVLGALGPAAWLFFASSFYGDLFPTSFYVKRPSFDGGAVLENVSYIVQFLFFLGAIPFGLALAFTPGFANGLGSTLSGHLQRMWSIRLGGFLVIVYGLAIATYHMMFSFRFFVPYVPAMILVLVDLLRRRAGAERRVPHAFTVVLGSFLLFQAIHLGYTHRRSLNGLVRGIGEYRTVGVSQYEDEFMATLRRSGEATMAHWARTGRANARPARLLTFAGGMFPYTCRGAYVYETLVSYRHNCVIVAGPNWTIYGKRTSDPSGALYPPKQFDLRKSADYVHVITPRHGSVAEHLPKPVTAYELVFDHEIFFEGERERVMVFYDADPEPHRLPTSMSGQS